MTQNVKQAQARADAMKAQALIDDAAKAAEQLTNAETMRAAMLAQAETYGASAVEGDMSQTKLAFLFNQAVRVSVLTEEDAGAVYLAYVKGYNASRIAKSKVTIGDVEVQAHGDVLGDADKGKGAEKTAISIFRTFGRAAVVGQSIGLFDRVRMLRDKVAADDRAQSSLFNAFVAVNRAVSKAADATSLSDADLLAGKMPAVEDALIEAAVTKQASTKTAAQKLEALVKACQKLVKSGDYDATLDQVLVTLGTVKLKVVSIVPDQTLVTMPRTQDAA